MLTNNTFRAWSKLADSSAASRSRSETGKLLPPLAPSAPPGFLNGLANLLSQAGSSPSAGGRSLASPAVPASFWPYLNRSAQTATASYSARAGVESGQASPHQPTSRAGLAAAKAGKFDRLIESAASKYGLDASLVKAVVQAESSHDPRAVSEAGAQGLMQLMPGTAKEMEVRDSFDPAQNLEGGARYLAKMLDRFDGDESKALAAYNWGPSNVERGGRQPRETREYVRKVREYRETYAQGKSSWA